MLVLFSLIQILVAIRLIDQGMGLSLLGHVVPGTPPLWVYIGLGLFAGTLSGIFGIGGGALVFLGLAAFYGVPVVEGLAIALALNVTNALAGVVPRARKGRVLWQELKFLIPAAIIGITIGATLAHELPADVLRIVFGGFFIFMGIMLARREWTGAKEKKLQHFTKLNRYRGKLRIIYITLILAHITKSLMSLGQDRKEFPSMFL
jgi:uncharacterized membrane protein YfcA